MGYGVGSRVLGFFIVFLLARNLSIDNFAWWQIGKAAATYILILMEAGFFFHIALLIQRDQFSIRSVRSQNYLHRMEIALFAIPFFFIYLHFTSVPLWYALFFLPFFAISVLDYDGVAVAANKSVETGQARLLKNGLTLFVIASIGLFDDLAITPIIASTIGAAGSAILLHRVVSKCKNLYQGKDYSRSLFASLSASRHFLAMQVAQTSMQIAGLMIAGIFLATNEVAHYGVALMMAELAIFPTYTIQRVIQGRYIKRPNASLAFKLCITTTSATIALHFLHYEFFAPLYTLLFPKFDQKLLHSVVNVLLLYVTIRTINTYLQLHMNSTERGKLVSTATAIGAATNISGNLALIPNIGLTAVPWITVVSEIVILLCLVSRIKKRG